MEKIEGYMKLVGGLIALIIPSMLLSGYSYHLGYSMTYGLNEDLIFKSMSEVLVESWYIGVMALAWLVSKWPYLLAYMVFLYLVRVLGFFGRGGKRKKVKHGCLKKLLLITKVKNFGA